VHVAHVGFHLDPQRRGPEELLCDWRSLVDIAEAAARFVGQLSVVQACARTESFSRQGVDYHFVAPPPGGAPRFVAQRCAEQVAARVAALKPDVIHVHGLNFPEAVTLLARHVPKTPVLLQDHADRPPRIWRRRAWRRGAAHAAGIAFCAREQLVPYAAARLLPTDIRIFEIPESSSRFRPGDREYARRLTGLHGEPAALWVGHLDSNKDPLTVLEAVRRVMRKLPKLELWCAYGSTTLLPELMRRVRADPALHGRVHLLGAVPHSRVELLMNAADVYISASHREGSGYALIEALACGLPPVVSDIPSFRALTAHGTIGDLWTCGDPDALAASLIKRAAQPRQEIRTQVRAHFIAELSFDALGRKLSAAYGALLNDRQATQEKSGRLRGQ
jgi:glycosyltransferase involved in cell wall biosynthesis